MIIQHLKQDECSGPNEIHPRNVKALEDVMSVRFAILFIKPLRQSKLSNYWKHVVISLVYCLWGKFLVTFTSVIVEQMEENYPCENE